MLVLIQIFLKAVNEVGFDILGVTTNTFRVFVGVSTFNHDYVTGGVVERTQLVLLLH